MIRKIQKLIKYTLLYIFSCDFTDTLEDLVKPFLDVKSLSYDYKLVLILSFSKFIFTLQ